MQSVVHVPLWLRVFNFATITAAISYRMTIFTDLLFYPIRYSRFAICAIIVFELLALLFNRWNGVVIRTNVLKFPPLRLLFILVVVQVLIAIIHLQIESVGAALFTGLNDFLLCILVYSLLCSRKQVLPKEYIYFAVFNIAVTVLAFFLTQVHILSPYTNEVNSLSSLFLGNSEAGQTYYMPGYLAIQSDNIRLLNVPYYLGWSFEPHVFCLFVLPAVFFMLGDTSKKSLKLIILIVGAFIFIESFSVTASLAGLACALLFFISSFSSSGRKNNALLIASIAIVLGFLLYSMGALRFDFSLLDYSRVKIYEDTSSLEYSTNNLEGLLIPNSIIGDGIFGWDIRHTKDPNIGLISYPFLIAYFASVLYYCIKLVKSKQTYYALIGVGVLYTILHMLKLAQAAFCMPFLYLMLVVLFRAHEERDITIKENR